MTQRSKKVRSQLYLERFTMKDKKSLFRDSDPDRYFLRIMAEVEDGRTVIVREFIFDTKFAQEETYRGFRSAFGM